MLGFGVGRVPGPWGPGQGGFGVLGREGVMGTWAGVAGLGRAGPGVQEWVEKGPKVLG